MYQLIPILIYLIGSETSVSPIDETEIPFPKVELNIVLKFEWSLTYNSLK